MFVSDSTYFSKSELMCEHCKKARMDQNFMNKLDALRWKFNHPIRLSSAYRCPKYNEKVGGVKDSPHTKGIAVDILIYGQEAHRLLGIALEMGFSGIGIKQHGEHKDRFIHLDIQTEGTRPWVWTYQ
ncbi:MAG: DUF882 domain-containing protein [Candidatus Dadabacteria bacterium]|nr:DUF882 domain-containing protein [Candidatus Dadabacteria bacterium]